MNTHAHNVLTDALRYDPAAWTELAVLKVSAPSDVASSIKEFLMSSEGIDAPDICAELMAMLRDIDGAIAIESWIVGGWPEFSRETKRKIIYWAHAPEGMSTELAVQLFDSGSSTVNERHLLATGLASSAARRGIAAQVLELLPRIGRYEEPQRQESLDAFIANAKRSFGA